MGFLDNLRMANIFGGQVPFGMPDLSAGGFNPDTIRESLNMAVPLINAAKQRNADLANPQPRLGAGFNPSLAQRVAGNMSGLNPADAQQPNVVWNSASDSHSDQNINKNLLARNALDSKNAIANAKIDQGDTNLGIKQQRADTYDYQMHNPIGKIVNPLGGDYTKIDPRTGIPMDTGVSTGTMTQSDKLDTDLRNKKDLTTTKSILDQYGADRKSDAASELQDKKGQQSLAEIGARNSKGSSVKLQTPGQKAQQWKNNFQQLKQTDPNGLGKWVTQNPDGSYSIASPSEGWGGHSGPTNDEFEALKKAIYGDDLSSQPGQQQSLPDPAGIRDLITPKKQNENDDSGEEE